MSKTIDYSSEDTISVDEDSLKQLSTLAERQQQFENDLVELEEKVSKKKKELEDVSVNLIPELMKKVKLETIQTTSGLTITIDEGLHCKIAKKNNEEAIAWLDANGYDKIVTREFVIHFNKEDAAWCKKFERDLSKRKKPLNCVQDQSVHHQTLKSQIKKMLEEGVDVPYKLFGIYHRPVSKIEQKKTKTQKKKETI